MISLVAFCKSYHLPEECADSLVIVDSTDFKSSLFPFDSLERQLAACTLDRAPFGGRFWFSLFVLR